MSATRHWSVLGSDPNSPSSVRDRRNQLENAWRDYVFVKGDTRVGTLAGYAKGKRVLDVGCVEHSAEMVDLASPRWLHAHVAHAAQEIVGVDVEADGVQRMADEGLDVYCHDLATGPGPLENLKRFDIAVIGEVIEHLPNAQAVLRSLSKVLVPGGRVVFSTPNPYAPWRVRAGQTRHVYESVDHVSYLFPSGMAELASRSGFALVEAYSVFYPTLRDSLGYGVDAVRRRLRGERQTENVLWPMGLDLPDVYVPPWEWLRLLPRRKYGWLGEHAIYVLVQAGG